MRSIPAFFASQTRNAAFRTATVRAHCSRVTGLAALVASVGCFFAGRALCGDSPPTGIFHCNTGESAELLGIDVSWACLETRRTASRVRVAVGKPPRGVAQGQGGVL